MDNKGNAAATQQVADPNVQAQTAQQSAATTQTAQANPADGKQAAKNNKKLKASASMENKKRRFKYKAQNDKGKIISGLSKVLGDFFV